MADDKTNVALITGASAGIGMEIAKALAADGENLLLVARREDRLRALADELSGKHNIKVHVLRADLADPAAPNQIFDFTQQNNFAVTTLINNAGFGLRGTFHELDRQRQLDMIQVNVTALTNLTHLFLPSMLENNHGRILNVASIAAFEPGPYMSIYHATKGFVLHFSEGIAEELRSTNVTVSCLCPGPTRTEFGEVSGLGSTIIFKFAAPVERVTRTALRAMKNKKMVAVHGFGNRAGLFLMRFTPRIVVRRVAGRLQK